MTQAKLNSKAIIVALAVASFAGAYASESKPWQPKEVGKGGESVGRNAMIIDFGGNYCPTRKDQYFVAGQMKIDKNLDLDNDGKKDDSISYVPFDLNVSSPEEQLYGIWDITLPSAKIYAAREHRTYNSQVCTIREGGGPNVDHSIGSDDLNMMGWDPKNPNTKFSAQGVWLWKKEDFLGFGDKYKVTFDKNSAIGLYIPRYWQNVDLSRMIVRDGEQFYISEKTNEGGWGTLHLVKPTETKWAKYYPKNPYPIFFDSANAKWEEHTFTNVTAVGYYITREKPSHEILGVKIGSFEVYANVNYPKAEISPTFEMKKIKKADGIPEFYIANAEVPFEQYARTHQRHDVASHFAMEKSFQFSKEPKIGSMMRMDKREYSQQEPVTGIPFLDAVAWCNGQSINDGFEPVYYEDAAFKTVFKRAIERLLDPKKYPVKVYVKWGANGYRLPTSSEWALAQGKDSKRNAKSTVTTPVCSGSPNKNGLYDMNGNVWEYVWDMGDSYYQAGDDRNKKITVLGGDIFYPQAPALNPASPYGDVPGLDGAWNIGFRVVRRESGLPAPSSSKENADVAKWSFSLTEVVGGGKKAVKAKNTIAMVAIPDGKIISENRNKDEIFVSAFNVGKTEVTYSQWIEVYHWAKANGYSFNYDGDMGSVRSSIGRTTHVPEEPVTNISMYDIAVWCNALSERSGKRPVYYLDDDRKIVYKNSQIERIPSVKYTAYAKRGTPLSETEKFNQAEERERLSRYALKLTSTHLVHDWSANGFRIMTNAESDRLKYKRSEFNYKDAAAVASIAWTKENSAMRTKPVAQLKPTLFGIYDFYGNVTEIAGWRGKPVFGETVNPKDYSYHPKTIGWVRPRVFGSSVLNDAGRIQFGDEYFSYRGHSAQGFRIMCVDDTPAITIGDKTYTLIGPKAKEIKALKGQKIEIEGKAEGRFLTVESFKIIK